jgi:hypothetical protein
MNETQTELPVSVCSVDGCEKPRRSRGSELCAMHNKRVQRHGDVNASRREHRAPSAREAALAEQRATLPRWPETNRTCHGVCHPDGVTKPIEEFAKGGGGYLGKVCKECKAEQHRRWRARNPEHVKEWHRQYNQTAERKKAHADRERHRYQSNPGPILSDRRLRLYGVTRDEYNALLEKQCGVCAICGNSCKSGRALGIDHNHVTGQIRGLLCGICNRAIGYLQDDPKLVQSALEYLLSFQT